MKFQIKRRDEIFATHRHHTIAITREPDGRLYIQVTCPRGCYAYDGWWGDERNTMDEAIREALRGAQIECSDSGEEG